MHPNHFFSALTGFPEVNLVYLFVVGWSRKKKSSGRSHSSQLEPNEPLQSSWSLSSQHYCHSMSLQLSVQQNKVYSCFDNSVDLYVHSILAPQVWVSSTPSTIVSFMVKFCAIFDFCIVKRIKIKKEAGSLFSLLGQIQSSSIGSLFLWRSKLDGWKNK